MKRRKKMINFLIGTLMWIFSLLILIPCAMIILNSLKDVPESMVMSLKLPSQFHFENYLEVLNDGQIVRSFFNSVLLSVGSGVLTMVLSFVAAFVLSRNRSRLNRFLYIIFLLGLVAPMNYVTTVKVLQFLHLINTFAGAILLYTAQYMPFTIFIYYGFVEGVEKTLDEAAVIDGCSSMRLFFQVIFPLMKPVTMTAVVINFLNCWNDFIVPLYFLNSAKKRGMIMLMYNYFSQYISSWNLVCAVMIVSMLPIIILYVAGQKYLVSGMTAGAVKG